MMLSIISRIPHRKLPPGCVKLLAAFVVLPVLSCDDWVEVGAPATMLVQEDVFMEDATALSAISSLYAQMSYGSSFASGGRESVTVMAGVYADELAYTASATSGAAMSYFYYNNLDAANPLLSSTWSDCYNLIYAANRLIEGLNASTGVSAGLVRQLIGEAKFVRVFCHFYLLNLFGDVPYITSTDYRVNATVFRNPSDQVYRRMIEDLIEAKDDLPEGYPSQGRARPNKGAATALLARLYLYHGEWLNAEEQATALIANTSQYSLAGLNDVFLNDSQEAIWQLLPDGGAALSTYEGSTFILRTTPSYVFMSQELYVAFEPGDLRKTNWTSAFGASGNVWPFPYKYKEQGANGTRKESSMVLRLAEQFLIRAEARVHLGKLTGANSAISDINTIRIRAGLANSTVSDKENILAAIERERRSELFTEWGHRLFDLKRNGKIDAVLTQVKPGWDSGDVNLPLPQSEVLINPNLLKDPQ